MKLEWSKTKPHLHLFIDHVFGGELKGKLLHVGCGNGSELLMIAREATSIYGVDDSSEAISQAKRKAELAGIPARFYVAKPEKLPFKEGTFDAVYSCYYLEDFDLKKAIQEIARVLKKGGFAYLVLGWRVEDPKSRDLLEERFSLSGLERLIKRSGFEILYEDTHETFMRRKRPPLKHTSVRFILRKRK